MADEQDQKSREDHWKELAALLGIEPESPPRSGPAKPNKPAPEARRDGPAPQRAAPQPRYEPEPPPRETVPVFDKVETMPGALEEAPAADPGDVLTDRDEAPQNESPDEAREREEGRGRRGGRRRRGRGRGGDRKDESRHKPYQRPRDEAPAPSDAPGAGPASEFDEPTEQTEMEDAPMEVIPARPRRGEERFASDESDDAADDLLEQPIPVDDDDEIDEEDAPAEWNVVTWSELIASLKRF